MLISIINKNDNIHKTSSRNQMNIDKYRVASNITEYYIISKLIFLRIFISKFMKIRQLYHVKNLCKVFKNQHAYNGRMDFVLGTIIPCLTSIEQFCLLTYINQ